MQVALHVSPFAVSHFPEITRVVRTTESDSSMNAVVSSNGRLIRARDWTERLSRRFVGQVAGGTLHGCISILRLTLLEQGRDEAQLRAIFPHLRSLKLEKRIERNFVPSLIRIGRGALKVQTTYFYSYFYSVYNVREVFKVFDLYLSSYVCYIFARKSRIFARFVIILSWAFRPTGE